MLYGIDVSSNQPADICSRVSHDFAIVKMSGNPQGYAWDYVNPYARRQAADAYRKHGRLGLYHFTYGLKDAKTEAAFFVGKVKELGYLGKAVLVVDYEAEAVERGRRWVSTFAAEVKRLAGYAPVIYASGSVIVEQRLFALGYPIWCANYSKGYQIIRGYDTSGCKIYGGCEEAVMWQYTSQGILPGYGGGLDCDVFFGDASDWAALHAREKTPAEKAAEAGYTAGTYEVTAKRARARARRAVASKACGTFKRGRKVRLGYLRMNRHGNVWGKVVQGRHKGRYVVVRYAGRERLRKVT